MVTITGTDLSGATSVSFGSTPGTITADTGTQITATSPPGTGTVDITVATPTGTSAVTTQDQFTYVPPTPTLSGISPASGSTAGGTPVTLTGTNLTGATSVSFGGTAAKISGDTGTQITVTSPPGSAGAVNVTVTTPAGTSNPESFTYVAPPPTVTSIDPSCGGSGGKTLVTITGTNLAGATSVTFGSLGGVSISSDTATQITVYSPPSNTTDILTVGITVTTPAGTSNAVQFTYPCQVSA